MLHKIFWLSGCLLLAACGFHLKGTLPYSALPAHTWQIQGNHLQSELKQAITRAQAEISPNSPYAIRVVVYEQRKDIYTITRAAKLNEYLLSLRVTAQAYRDGKAWGAPIVAKAERTHSYSDSMILGKAHEENAIWQDIHHDVAEQIVRQMAFLKDE